MTELRYGGYLAEEEILEEILSKIPEDITEDITEVDAIRGLQIHKGSRIYRRQIYAGPFESSALLFQVIISQYYHK